MESRELVLAFVQRMTELTGELTGALSTTTGGSDLRSVVAAANQRRLPREGEIPGGVRYHVHGVGCWIKAPDGAEIDVDLGPEPPLIQFDAWRVHMFAESIGEASTTRQELAQALRELTDQGLISRIPSPYDWYTVTNQEGDRWRTWSYRAEGPRDDHGCL